MKSAVTGPPDSSLNAQSISPVCRCVSSPYGVTVSFASENRLGSLSPRPRPDTPEAAWTTRPSGDGEARGQERREREDRGRRVAAGDRDPDVRGEPVTEQLGQAEREPVEQRRCGVRRAVPLLVRRGGQPEVGAEVDDVPDASEQVGHETLRLAVRQREERDVDAVHHGGVPRLEDQSLIRGRQRRVQVGDRRAGVRRRDGPGRPELVVAREQAQQLGAGVPRRPDHRRLIRHAA